MKARQTTRLFFAPEPIGHTWPHVRLVWGAFHPGPKSPATPVISITYRNRAGDLSLSGTHPWCASNERGFIQTSLTIIINVI